VPRGAVLCASAHAVARVRQRARECSVGREKAAGGRGGNAWRGRVAQCMAVRSACAQHAVRR